MRDYEGLVKSLRICADSADPISECRFSDCCEHDEPIDPLCMGQLIHMAADAIEELQRQVRALAEDNAAKYSGRVYILDQVAALAAAAGAKAIRGSKRLVGTTYVYDPFGKDGGPYEITYHQAEGILRAIWEGYPLKQEVDDGGCATREANP